MPIGAIAAAAMPALAGGVMNFFGGERTNAANAHQAQQNRDFQERMSSTSYQRAVKDMTAAGLNPALAYQQGGASSPSGSTAQMQNSIAGGVSGAIAAAQARADLERTKAETHKIGVETQTNANLAKHQIPVLLAQALEIGERGKAQERSNAPEWIGYAREQMKAAIQQLQSSAAESHSRIQINEMHPKALVNKFLDRVGDPFGSSAWEKYMQSQRR